MTSKIYRSAQGKSIDLGTIILQNENVRAVGNMNVNARGDKINNQNEVIETKTQQIQKQNDRTSTNVSPSPVHTSSKKVRKPAPTVEATIDTTPDPVEEIEIPEPVLYVAPIAPPEPVIQSAPVVAPAPPTPVAQPRPKAPEVDLKNPVRPPKSPVSETVAPAQGGGLAGAIARSREIKQDLDKTRRQQAQDKGVRKI